jgi:hypothetical protein
MAKSAVIMKVKMIFADDGKSVDGFIFEATSKKGVELINGLMHGENPGLEYGENATVRPFAGGSGTYCIKILSAKK